MKTKAFHIGDILSVTSGYLLSPRHMEGVYEILNFLTGDNLYTHQLGRAMEAARPHLFTKYPLLATITELTHAKRRELGEAWKTEHGPWLIELAAEHGSHFEIEPMPTGEWLQIDPIKELEAMTSKPIVVVDATRTER